MIRTYKVAADFLAVNSEVRIALPEVEDSRVIKAACFLARKNIVSPLLIFGLNMPNTIEEIKKQAPIKEVFLVKDSNSIKLKSFSNTEKNVNVLEVFNIQTKENHRLLCELLLDLRRHKGMDEKQAFEESALPVTIASLLASQGLIHGSVAGATIPSADVIRTAIQIIGVAPGIKTVSSCFLMLTSLGTMSFADCAIVPEPSAEQLADIALSTAKTHTQLTGEVARVALLSFSTKGSASHPKVDKIINALQIIKEKAPKMCCDGELQLDAAIVPQIAKAKAPQSNIAGKANVLIFPDLNSGNIGYKLTQRFANATALGPLVQGLKVPFMDLSRGCSSDDITLVAAIAGIIAEKQNSEKLDK